MATHLHVNINITIICFIGMMLPYSQCKWFAIHKLSENIVSNIFVQKLCTIRRHLRGQGIKLQIGAVSAN